MEQVLIRSDKDLPDLRTLSAWDEYIDKAKEEIKRFRGEEQMATKWTPKPSASAKAKISKQAESSNLSKPATKSTLTAKSGTNQRIAANEQSSWIDSGYNTPIYYTPSKVPTSAPKSSPVPKATKPVSAPITKAVGSDSSKSSTEKSITEQIAERNKLALTESGAKQAMKQAPVGSQRIETDSEGNRTVRYKLSEETYIEQVYSPAGNLISSGSKSLASIAPSGVVPGEARLKAMAAPGSEKTIDQESSTLRAPKTPETFEAPETPETFDTPATFTPPVAPGSFSSPDSTPIVGTKSKEISGDVVAALQGTPTATKYVKADGGAGELTPSQYAGLGSDQQAAWKPVYSSDQVVESLSSNTLVDAILKSESGSTLLDLGSTATDRTYSYPVTNDQVIDAYTRAMDSYNPSGIANGDNADIVNYFAPLVPSIIQGKVSTSGLSSAINDYEILLNGDVSTQSMTYVPGTGYVAKQTDKPFKDLDYNDQTEALRDFYVNCLNAGVPPVYTIMLISGLIDSEETESTKQSLSGYVTNGQFEKDLKSVSAGDFLSKFTTSLDSDAGLMTIGGIFGAVGVVGATLASGGTAGLAATGTSLFSTTELLAPFGSNVFRDREERRQSNQDAQTQRDKFEDKYNEVNKYVQSLDSNKKTLSPEVYLQTKEEAYKLVGEAEVALGDEFVFSQFLGTWDIDKSRVESLRKTLDRITSQYTEEGIQITGAQDKPAELTLNVPEGYSVKIYDPYAGEDFVSGAQWNRQLTGSGQVAYEIYDKDGNKVGADKITYYPNMVWSGYAKPGTSYGTKTDKTKSTVYTVTVPLGATLAYAGKSYEGGKSYDIPVSEGMSNNAIISQPGRKDEEKVLYAVDQAWVGWKPVLQADPYYTVPGAKTYGQIDLQTSPDSTVTINGKQFTPSGNKTIVPVVSGYYSVKVSRPGYEDWEKTIYVGDGQTLAVSDPSQTIKEEEEYQSYSSGGGGGGSSGGSYGGSSSVTYGLIKYGNACTGAEIWQDEVRVYPVVEQEYSIDPGYHAIKISKPGKKTWLKTVYVSAGDSITVSPALVLFAICVQIIVIINAINVLIK